MATCRAQLPQQVTVSTIGTRLTETWTLSDDVMSSNQQVKQGETFGRRMHHFMISETEHRATCPVKKLSMVPSHFCTLHGLFDTP